MLHIASGDLWGGAEAQVELQLRALLDTPWHPHLILFNSGAVAERMQQQGIPVKVAAESGGIAATIYSAVKLAMSLRPVVVVSHGYKEALVGLFVSRILGIPLVTTYHGLTENLPGIRGLKMRFYQFLQLSISKYFAAGIVTVSQRLATDLGFEDNRRLRVIRNVTAPAVLQPRSELTHDPGKPVELLALGRLVPVKRLDLLIEAAGILRSRSIGRQIEVKIVGDGPERQRLEQLSAAAGLSGMVHFLGFCSDPGPLLKSSSALIICSDSEGIPTTLLEAIAVLTPVVATDVGGIAEVLWQFSNYPARLIRPGSAMELADGIEALLNGPCPDPDPAAVAAALNKYFSPQAAADQLTSLYDSLIR